MLTPASYGFRNEDRSILTIDSIGWQTINSPAYSFAGEERPDTGHVIFQYTLSGQGCIEYEQQSYPLPKGSGFLIKVPGRHRYYFPEGGEPWEVIWLNIRGEEATRLWDLVTAREGPVIRRETDSPVIEGFWRLFRMIAEEKVTDKYLLSAQVYEWMLTLVRTSTDDGKEISETSSTMIEKAKRYMKENYALPVTLETLSGHCGVNKHHLCRLFQKSERTSPLAYLRDRRVEAAVALLRTTELPIHEIGRRCGFESPSYFGKVFRHYMAMTPKEYRMKTLEFPYDAIFYE
ncbi:AraC family transcriptional regulator [Paenibacillus mucilaginosus 3016]|uniref:AraC family transcriptional regulator n=1 Tax=Paenibacillus mucilaginosus 3016 TaxID=1116391 RepID=H6NJW0_9BACL|nr:AraC family transcriptional regulator [Paenibacillus mucilaginosus]AFC30264.1 AraC family transcriptional regulator [Paenibacillus mucilaginosus 3016]WFA18908.1 AraC family transcriptional regulator [Paenibacillus mucilaginosus]